MASSARIEELQKKFEENPRRYFAPLANEYRKAGDIDQAIIICREYLPQQPGHMSGHIVYGQALYEARQFEEAKAVFETALSLDPENLIALRHLGDIALIVGDSDAARSWYRRVLEADPRNEEIQAQLATLDQSAAAAAQTPSTAPSMPTPSSVPTVVVAAVKPAADAQRTGQDALAEPKPKTQPVPEAGAEPPAVWQPVASTGSGTPTVVESLSSTPTSEVRLDTVPGAAPTAPAFHLEATSDGSAPRETAAPSSFALAGLETTSFSEPPTPPSETPPTFETSATSAAHAAIPAPAVEAPEEPASAPLPFLDLGQAPQSQPQAPQHAAATSVPLLELDQPTANALPVTPEPASAALPLLDLGEPGPPELPAPESGPFVTETMAELYLQQGHREEALRVYRALLEQRPGDVTLRAKVAGLESAAAPQAASAPESRKDVPAAGAPAIPAIPAIRPGPAGRADRPRPTIREALRVVAVRRPGSGALADRGNGAPSVQAPQPSAQPAAKPAAQPVAEPAVQPASQQASAAPRSDAISALFGNAQVSSTDESAARALSFAFADQTGGGATDRAATTGVEGAPARRASNELSLDSVFGGDASGAPAAPSSFSFDQFFSRGAPTQQPSGAAPTPGGGAKADSPDEVAHFTQWLEGLKQR